MSENKEIYLSAALVCDRLLEEKDNVVSAIRIIDFIQADIPPDLGRRGDELNFPPAKATFFLSLKSFEFEGEKDIRISVHQPQSHQVMDVDLMAKFSKRVGFNYFLEFNVAMRKPGVVWIEVSVDKEMLTRIPLEVRHVVANSGEPPSGALPASLVPQ